MPAVLKSAVIGTGVISKQHLSFLQASQRANIVGVCDLSPAAVNYAVDTFQAAAAYTDYAQMLEEAKPDVVHILTPPATHLPIATDCLRAGAHVICEKPVAPSFNEFKDLWQISRECDRFLIEDHNYRFNSPVRAIQELVDDGTLGKIQEVEIRMALDLRSGGRYADENMPSPIHKMPAGVIHDFITHLSYLLLSFLPEVDSGDGFERVSAAWSNHGGGDLFKYDDLDALVIGGQAHGRIRFSSYTSPDCFSITVRGDRGYAETDLFQPYLRCVVPRSGGKQLSPLVNHFANGWELMSASARNFRNKIMQKTPYEGLHYLLGQTYDALSEGQAPPISYDDMARTSRLVEALLAQENRL
ncbi:MAG: Gfo/Idh/MocA family oxidoreductase [Cyanobacteria bacterium P01_F01_bin.53]